MQDINKIKYGNPGIRTQVWSKMTGMYGEAIGTFIGLNMDLSVQLLNQGFITPLEKLSKNFKNKEKETETTDYKTVKIE